MARWQRTFDSRALSQDCRADLLQTLLIRERTALEHSEFCSTLRQFRRVPKRSRADVENRAAAIVDGVGLHVAEYLHDRELESAALRARANNATVKALDRWIPKTIELAKELEARLDSCPVMGDRFPSESDGPWLSEFRDERLRLKRAINDFSTWLWWTGAEKPRGSGKPVDGRRELLEINIGMTLAEAGIRVTTPINGTFGLVLQVVRVEIGLPSGDGIAKSVRRAHAALPLCFSRQPVPRVKPKSGS